MACLPQPLLPLQPEETTFLKSQLWGKETPITWGLSRGWAPSNGICVVS